jgi:aminomethyltransferase
LTAPAAHLQQTALNSVHRRMGARMVPFGGWDMPVEYSGIIPEHLAVRRAAGLFDVSHMGELDIRGPQALDLVQWVCCNDANRLAIGQAQYSGLMTEQGTFVDDLLVHKMANDHYWLVVNAANTDADFAHIQAHNRFDAEVTNTSARYAQLALQGPRALEILQPLTATPLAAIQYYWFAHGQVLGVDAIIARTGYTGEDGFELYFDPRHAERLWTALLAAGETAGLIACGLGARNTLRLEAGMALYGHEIDAATTPWEANLGWICKMSKPGFLGQERLEAAKANPPARRLVGFEMTEPGIARDGYPILSAGDGSPDAAAIGRVTSGSPAPFLGKNIGMAYVPPAAAQPGTQLKIGIRQRAAAAVVTPLPFYRRGKGGGTDNAPAGGNAGGNAAALPA